MIQQGDVFWIDLGDPSGSEPAYCRPFMVIQNNLFNRSRLNTVVVCAITSNLQRTKSPGNVALQKGEANLPKQSVVNVTQIFTVDKQILCEKLGSLSHERIAQILKGIEILITPMDIKE